MRLITAPQVCAILVFFGVAPAAAQQDTAQPPLGRWFQVDFAQLDTRYRIIENSAGVRTNDEQQHREQFRAHFNVDHERRYVVHAGLFTGSSFTSGWNNTGIGTGSLAANLRLRQLYAAAAPVRGVQLQLGSLYILRGESTDITTYDEDGYIMGERVQVARPGSLFVDEVAFTEARLGDTARPNVAHRWGGLHEPNYRQFFLRKRFGPAFAASTDFTTVEGARTLRVAAAWTPTPVSVRVEAYRRVRLKRAGGFALTVERSLARPVRIGGGYAAIDGAYGGLNNDRFNRGRRLFVISTVTVLPSLNVSLFATRALRNDFEISNRTRFDIVLTYNLLRDLHRTGLF